MANEKEQPRTIREYCAECMNAGTPICEGCSFIQRPSGKSSAPTRHVGSRSAGVENQHAASLAARITRCLTTGAPIPVRWILQYNDLVTDENRS